MLKRTQLAVFKQVISNLQARVYGAGMSVALDTVLIEGGLCYLWLTTESSSNQRRCRYYRRMIRRASDVLRTNDPNAALCY
jgi:hypothetical protein